MDIVLSKNSFKCAVFKIFDVQTIFLVKNNKEISNKTEKFKS